MLSLQNVHDTLCVCEIRSFNVESVVFLDCVHQFFTDFRVKVLLWSMFLILLAVKNFLGV